MSELWVTLCINYEMALPFLHYVQMVESTVRKFLKRRSTDVKNFHLFNSARLIKAPVRMWLAP